MPEDIQMPIASLELKSTPESHSFVGVRHSTHDLLLAQTEEKLSALSKTVFNSMQDIVLELNIHHQESLHRSTDEARKLERHLKEQTSAFEILKVEYENLLSKVNGLQKLLQSERTEKSKLFEQNAEQQNQLAAQEREITHLNNLISQLQQKMNQAQKMHDEKVQALQVDNERLIQEKGMLEQTVTHREDEYHVLIQNYEEITQKMQLLVLDNEQSAESINSLTHENESLKHKVNSLSLELQNEHASYLAEMDRQKKELEESIKKAELDAKSFIATERQQFINQSKAQAAASAQQIKALEAAHHKALQAKEREFTMTLQKQKDSYNLGLEKRDYDHTQNLHMEIQKLKDAYLLTRNNELKKQALLLRKTQEESLASARLEVRAEYQEKVRHLEKRLAVLLEEKALLITAENKRKQKNPLA